MTDVLYTYAKLGEATQVLATHPGRIRERLMEAATHLAIVNEKVFVEEGIYYEASEFWKNRVWGPLTSAPRDEKRGSIGPSIDAMTEDQACAVAQSLVSLESMVASFIEDHKK